MKDRVAEKEANDVGVECGCSLGGGGVADLLLLLVVNAGAADDETKDGAAERRRFLSPSTFSASSEPCDASE